MRKCIMAYSYNWVSKEHWGNSINRSQEPLFDTLQKKSIE